jgi:hypothetical protein
MEAGSTWPKDDAEGVATSRHRRDEFNLRAFVNAVKLNDFRDVRSGLSEATERFGTTGEAVRRPSGVERRVAAESITDGPLTCPVSLPLAGQLPERRHHPLRT